MKRKTLTQLAADLESGAATSRQLVEEGLTRIADPAGEGLRAFVAVAAEPALAEADRIDKLRRIGRAPGPFAGIPVAIKDLFDVAGEVTRAGSRVLDDQPPARRDATAVARLRAAGFIAIGRTNMTEFAYSGLGMNDHYGTPRNPWDRATGRIPGGSTSGGAVSVADGMAAAALGSDTGGSCRIPAALCGIVGLKSTVARVPRDGVVPLSTSLDSIGPLANSVECCALLDGLLAGGDAEPAGEFPLAGLRLMVPRTLVMDGLDATVSAAFERAMAMLAKAGARIREAEFAELAEIPKINAKGGLIAAEAYAWHRPLLERHADRYDRWVLGRFETGKAMLAADYLDTAAARADLIRRAAAVTTTVDAVILPTTAIVAPTLAEMADTEVSRKTNLLLLRNTAVGNFLDRCAISLPCHATAEPPVGLMLMGENGGDRRLLAMAAGVEQILAPLRM